MSNVLAFLYSLVSQGYLKSPDAMAEVTSAADLLHRKVYMDFTVAGYSLS